MGDVYFIASYYEHRGEPLKRAEVKYRLVVPSEIVPTIYPLSDDREPAIDMNNPPLDRSRPLSLGGGTCGIWFYESNMWGVELLKKKLRELIEEVDTIAKEYGYKLVKYDKKPIGHHASPHRKTQRVRTSLSGKS